MAVDQCSQFECDLAVERAAECRDYRLTVDVLPAASGEDSYGKGESASFACFGGFLPQPPYSAEDCEEA